MQIYKSQINGILRIEKRVNNILYKRTYIDHSENEAKKDFKKYIKSLSND